ncbi:MAG: transferase [Firmicutes bacterium]|nr:transferase [Bacillota bacterium]
MTILIIGAGGMGRDVMDAVEKNGTYRIDGFIDDTIPVGSDISGYKILGTIADLAKIAKDIDKGIIAIGDNWQRGKVARKIKNASKTFHFVNVIHPSACIARNAQIGDGAILLAESIVSSNAIMGKHTLLHIGSMLGHDSKLGNYGCMLPGSKVGGNVRIGEYSSIGIGATLIHGITIGNHSFIGAGAIVISNIPSNVVAYGVPAIAARNRRKSEKHL